MSEFRIAERLGLTWGEVRALPKKERVYWMAYDRHFPLHDSWYQTALILSAIFSFGESGVKPDDIFGCLTRRKDDPNTGQDGDLAFSQLEAYVIATRR
ncbi:MAG: hypothetical protein ABS70_00530 [Nitrospira sp. SCN 59-13]|nr:MAG: hypothetical protein ABS70_00530 [Nitrospira sp. SCN 59-13]